MLLRWDNQCFVNAMAIKSSVLLCQRSPSWRNDYVAFNNQAGASSVKEAFGHTIPMSSVNFVGRVYLLSVRLTLHTLIHQHKVLCREY